MSEIFSFLQHPMISSLGHIPTILRSIEKVLVFYYNNNTLAIEGKFVVIDDNYDQIHDLDLSDLKVSINNLRQGGMNASWYAQDELDFEIQIEKGRQLQLLQEDKRKILKICFENENDKKCDLIFIYFNSLLNVLPNQLASDKKKLSTNDKSIIQFLVQSSLTAFLETEKKNKKINDIISQNDSNLYSENEKLKKKICMIEERYGGSLISFCMMYLKNIEAADKYFFKFEFSEDCINKIKTYNGKLENLEKIIVNAAIHATNKCSDFGSKKVIINDYSLNFDMIHEKLSDDLKGKGFDEFDGTQFYKAISLLNKYEDAVLLLIKDGKKVTITSVGENCKPFKVTGAAVSDAIKTYIDDFRKLFEKYPGKWPNAKKLLKPITTRIIDSKVIHSKQA